MKIFSLLLPGLAALATAAASEDAAPLKIKGAAFANWWNLEDTVSFKVESGVPPKEAVQIAAKVFDSSGTKTHESFVDAASFAAEGWLWKPSLPGLYTVEFSLLDANGAESGIEETATAQVRDTATWGLKAEKAFKYRAHWFAVLPGKARPPKDCPPALGASVGWVVKNKADIENELLACEMLGLHFIRLQPLYWAKIEKENGVYDWTEPDWWIEGARKRGFGIVLNPWGTPKWAASNRSEETTFIFHAYKQSMPAKIEYWTDFLKAAMGRYPDVKEWQLWNEAGMSSQSCFWNGTPEQYFELLKTGCEAIKARKPDAIIWNGCPLPDLYEATMKMGTADYFDKLDLHGRWIDQARRHGAVEKSVGARKPWGSLEWHAVLNSASSPRLSEEALSHGMLLDFMNMTRAGSELAAVHCVFNGGFEMEMLDFSRDNGVGSNQAAGFFRRQPRFEPRLPAVVFRNFMDSFSGRISYVDGFAFPDGLQCASLLKSDSGNVLAVWQNSGKDAVKVAPLLAGAFSSSSTLLDWEGRVQKADLNFTLKPGIVYILRNPDMKAVSAWNCKAQVLIKENSAGIELDNSVNGRYPGRQTL